MRANSSGSKTSEVRYKAWGEDRYTSGTSPTSIRYTGQRVEATLGLYYYGARWYDPVLGRFVQADSVVPSMGDPQAWDRYAYVNNNPVINIDPTGHMLDQGGGGSSMGDDWWKKRQDKTPKPPKTQYSDWYSGAYSGCAMCHYSRGTPYTRLTNTQLADADNNAREAAGLATVAAVTGTVIGIGLASAGVSGLVEAACADGDCTNEIGATGEIGEQYLTQAGGQSQVQFQTTQGVRVVDQLVNGMAYESKVGYTPLTNRISLEVSKDVELLVTGQVNSYSWVFFQSPITGAGGPSGPLYNLLIQNGINVYYVLP